MRCAANLCFRDAFRVVADVPLCLDHLQGARKALELPGEDTSMARFSVVYYLAQCDRVKIGTSQNVHKRMQALSKMTGPVHLLAVEPGGFYLEKKRHKQFKRLQVGNSEWFQMAGGLQNLIDDIVSRYGRAKCNCPASSGRSCPAGL